MATNIFSLPPELHHLVKDSIPPFDLRTHVCFYLSHPQLAALYGSEDQQETFWKLACWECGLGALPQENVSTIKWRDIAFECIGVDGFCTHQQCGESLLEYNRKQMQEAAEHVQLFEPLCVAEDTPVLLEAHRVFGHIRFRESDEATPKIPVELDAYLHPETTINFSLDPDQHSRPYLRDHPLVARSFATSTPVTSMFLLNLCRHTTTRHHTLRLTRPVTVLDVLHLIQRRLDEVLNAPAAYDGSHSECIAKKRLSPEEVVDKVKYNRDMLAICPIKHLEHEANTPFSGPAFSFQLH